eukprot:11210252-Lingulodinium_polyedra.AAC.1
MLLRPLCPSRLLPDTPLSDPAGHGPEKRPPIRALPLTRNAAPQSGLHSGQQHDEAYGPHAPQPS